MYDTLTEGLKQADQDPEVMFTIFTGIGDFYSSGNDFGPENAANMAANEESSSQSILNFILTLVAHTKPLIALVNGPAIGVACTTLAHFDLVIATDKAYFHCPFTEFGMVPEAGSTYTFAQIMGHTKATQIAMFAEKMNAYDVFIAGFVAKVIPDAKFKEETEKLVQKYTQLSGPSMILSKAMMRREDVKNRISDVVLYESKHFQERLKAEDTMERMMSKFMNAKI